MRINIVSILMPLIIVGITLTVGMLIISDMENSGNTISVVEDTDPPKIDTYDYDYVEDSDYMDVTYGSPEKKYLENKEDVVKDGEEDITLSTFLDIETISNFSPIITLVLVGGILLSLVSFFRVGHGR